eukprot:14909452-Alexandrium_andersonii.AAC.1
MKYNSKVLRTRAKWREGAVPTEYCAERAGVCASSRSSESRVGAPYRLRTGSPRAPPTRSSAVIRWPRE